MQPKITIGFAHYKDFHGAYFTAASIVLHHAAVAARAELVVADNSPDSPDSKELLGYLRNSGKAWAAVKYIPLPENSGTTQPRQKIFDAATGEAVLVMDCHVLLANGALERLLAWYDAHPDCRDLLTGPMVYDDRGGKATHFEEAWRSEMWGAWATDERGLDPEAAPFEIWGQGLGLFTCRRDAWLGFNPHFRGFGGEEGYIHEKFRLAGRRAMCLPFLEWMHRFGRPGGAPYPATRYWRVRNYVLGHQELGLPLDPVYDHFVELRVGGPGSDSRPPTDEAQRERLRGHLDKVHSISRQDTEGKGLEELEQLHAKRKIPLAWWEHLLADPIRHQHPPDLAPGAPGSASPASSRGGGGNQPPAGASLEEIYDWTVGKPRDLDRHAGKLRELAGKCQHVTALVKRREWDVFLGAGRPNTLVVHQAERDPLSDALRRAFAAEMEKSQGDKEAGEEAPRRVETYTVHTGAAADSLAADIEGTDMLVIDTVHHGERLRRELARHIAKVRRFLVLRGTGAFGEKSEDGKGPGLLPAVRALVRDNPEWSVVHHTDNQYGLTVLARLATDKPRLPGKIEMAKNFSKALAAHVADGGKKVSGEQLEARLEICTLCDQRAENRCAKCGCYLAEKAAWRSSQCPLAKWAPVDARHAGEARHGDTF